MSKSKENTRSASATTSDLIHNDMLNRTVNYLQERGIDQQPYDVKREVGFVLKELVEIMTGKKGDENKAIVDQILSVIENAGGSEATDERKMKCHMDILNFSFSAMYKKFSGDTVDLFNNIYNELDKNDAKPKGIDAQSGLNYKNAGDVPTEKKSANMKHQKRTVDLSKELEQQEKMKYNSEFDAGSASSKEN